MKNTGIRWKVRSVYIFVAISGIFVVVGLLILTLNHLDHSNGVNLPIRLEYMGNATTIVENDFRSDPPTESKKESKSCATVEQMGDVFGGEYRKESLRVRKLIHDHFDLHGAPRIRELQPEQFCRHGFVIGKASEAGFGNEMYKILNAAALSIMLNRSLIIGQTRGKYPFENFISYSKLTFTLKEVKHLWRQNRCVKKFGRQLVIRVDDFQKPAQTSVLCGNIKEWRDPIIWFQGATDAVGVQFFLKNVHPEMKISASRLFGRPNILHSRPNTFGELMKFLVFPSEVIEDAVNWVVAGGMNPDISLHMRMLMNRPIRAIHASLKCAKKAIGKLPSVSRPVVALVSDTPNFITSITPHVKEFAEVLHFDYKVYRGSLSGKINGTRTLNFRSRDWGPAPRWVAFVDFFLASRAKHAVISSAHRRVGTTYAQLIAALAAAQNLEENIWNDTYFSFLSSFHSNLLSEGLRNQVGWGHVWNRFAGPLSCRSQPEQCAKTPLLPPAWWDDTWQSPIDRDIRRLESYGVKVSGVGTIDEQRLELHCKSMRFRVTTIPIITKMR